MVSSGLVNIWSVVQDKRQQIPVVFAGPCVESKQILLRGTSLDNLCDGSHEIQYASPLHVLIWLGSASTYSPVPQPHTQGVTLSLQNAVGPTLRLGRSQIVVTNTDGFRSMPCRDPATRVPSAAKCRPRSLDRNCPQPQKIPGTSSYSDPYSRSCWDVLAIGIEMFLTLLDLGGRLRECRKVRHTIRAGADAHCRPPSQSTSEHRC